MTGADEMFMRRALALARRGLGRTSPNPCVGAVVVRRGKIVGEGWHRRAGGDHAEREALSRAGRAPKGAPPSTLYVTLEPCCTWGRTPPCTEAILKAGIQRVVVGAVDPNPKHRGRGLAILRRAGIQVTSGVLAAEAQALNAAFRKWITTGVPLVTVKAAVSLDGKIATRRGDSKWITDTAARREAHRLRAQVDAVLVTAGTVRRDDPSLTLRHGVRGRQPWRVVVDAQGRSPRTAQLFTDRWRQRTIVVTTRQSPAVWRQALARRGIQVLVVAGQGGHVKLRALWVALGQMEITSVLVEGGGDFVGALLEAGWVDRVAFFYAPILIGGRTAPSAVDGSGVARLAAATRLRQVQWRQLPGGQMLVTADVARPARSAWRKGRRASA
jgi:diaminohydroxyphosphoribosylaminopyrimidine deaminase/5-amino-6-(5-phosphoribosylamino)uracil reductase